MFRFLILSALVACTFGNGILPRYLSPAGRIVGGKDTTIEKHPYQVSVRGLNGTHICGGSILGSRKILSAAHCLKSLPQNGITIQYGTTKLGTNKNVISVAKTIKHSDYDVCIFLLNDDIPFSESAEIIKLAKEEPNAGVKAIVTGWGHLYYGSKDLSTILQEVEVNIVDREACQLSYGNTIRDSELCAGVKGGGKDSCQFDSGGPLVVDKILVGVVARGEECGLAKYPGIYTSVAGVRDWIDSH